MIGHPTESNAGKNFISISAESIHTGIKTDTGAHHMRGYFRCEECRKVCHLIGFAIALVKVCRAKNLLAFFVGLSISEGVLLYAVDHGRIYSAGADIVAVNSVRSELQRDRFCNACYSVLR